MCQKIADFLLLEAGKLTLQLGTMLHVVTTLG